MTKNFDVYIGGSVVECLKQGGGAADSSLTDVTALCPWARTLILVCTGSTEEDRSLHNWKLLMGRKESKQKQKKNIDVYILKTWFQSNFSVIWIESNGHAQI